MIKIRTLPANKKSVIYALIFLLFSSAVILTSVFTQTSKKGNEGSFKEGKYEEPQLLDDSVLRIVQATPQGDLPLSDSMKEIYVMFNYPIVPLSTLDEETKNILQISPSVKGKARWYGSRIYSFRPDDGWETGREYKITVPGGIKALNGKTLKGNYNFLFKIPAPELTASISRSSWGSSTIDYDQSFQVSFNFPVKMEDLYRHLSIKSGLLKSYSVKIIPMKKNQYYGYDYEYSDESESRDEPDNKRFLVKPEKQFERDSEIVITVRKGLKSENRISLLPENQQSVFKTHGPLEVTFQNDAAYYQQRWDTKFEFNNKVNLKKAVEAIRFSPKAEYKGVPGNKDVNYINFTMWNTKPGVSYKITVNRFADVYGNQLAKKGEFEFEALDYAPEYSIESEMNLIEAESGHRLPVETINIQQFDVSWGKFTIGDLQKKMSDTKREFVMADNISLKSLKWDTGLSKNTMGRLGFSLSDYLSEGKYGWIALRFKATVFNSWQKEYKEQIVDQIIQSTNLSVTVKEDLNRFYFWVNTLSAAESRSGVKIEIYDTKRRTGSGTTDAQGYCEIVKSRAGMDRDIIFLATDKNGDMTYLTGNESAISMYGLGDYSEETHRKTIRGQIIFDRKLYRPGDQVSFKGILAEKTGGNFKPLTGDKVKVSIEDSSGENVYSENIKSSRNGGVWGNFTIPADAKLGHYQINFSSGDKEENYINDTFQVEEFRPVTFSVDIDGMKNARSGETVELKVVGKYLFGAPMSQAPVSYTISRSRRSMTFEKFSGFTFGDNLYWFSEEGNQPQTGYYSGAEGRLNTAGILGINVELKPMEFTEVINKPESKFKLSDPYDIDIEATVRDVDEKSVTGSGSFSVFPGSFVIGIKLDNSYQSFKNEFRFDIVAASNSGGIVTDKKAELRIVKNIWKTVNVKGPEGSIQVKNTLEKEIVLKKDITLSSDPGTIKYRPSEPGIYSVTVQEKGGMSYSRTSFYAFGGEFGSWGNNDDDSITLVPDKSSYEPGDTARILVQSPYKNCKAIITLERESVYWQKTVTLDGKGTPVEVPIKEEYTPNVYLSVMLVRPRITLDPSADAEARKNFEENDLGAPRFKAGMTRLNISTKSKNAKLSIETDKEHYSPGEKIKLKIYSDPEAEIAVSVADRGVLDLVNYMFADPMKKFYSYYTLGVRIFNNMRLIVKQYKYALKGGSPGGSGDEDQYGDAIEGGMQGGGGFGLKNEDGTRSDIKYTAYWNPEITADKNGYAEVEFKLPDNLTTFRVMAFASAGGRYKEFKREFKVRKAMVIQKSVPRFIRCGDKLMIGAVVINQTGISGRFKVSIEGDLLNLESPVKSVVIEPGEAKEVLFPVSVNNKKYADLNKSIVDDIRNGKKDINNVISNKGYLTVEPENMEKFSRAGFELRDVKDRLFYEFPVKEHTPEEAFTITGFTDSSYSEMIKLPQKSSIFPEFGGLDVKLSTTALLGLERGFSFYESNPYFCLEQRASAFLLAITSGKLLKEFSVRAPDKNSYDFDQIEKLFLGELKDFRNADGGFSVWKNSGAGSKSNPYLTAYVNFVLLTAESRGYEVDKEIHAGAVTYLKNYMKEPESEGYSYILETFSFINYTFSVAGLKDQFLTSVLLEKKNLLSMRAKGYLSLSLALQRGVKNYSDDPEIKSLIDTFKNSMEITARKVSFKDSGSGSHMRAFYSEGSTLGVVLMAMMKLDRENPLIPGMVNYIISSREHSYWENTQSIALIALALDEYHNTYEKTGTAGGEITGRVLMNSKELVKNSFKQDTLSGFSGNAAFDSLYAKGTSGVNLPLEFKKEGNGGRLYYAATLKYQPVLAKVLPRDEGIEVRRTLYDLSTATEKNIYGNEIRDNLKRGEVYLCRITVINPKPYYNAVIVDPLPSNVEILNSSFATEKKNDIVSAGSGSDEYDYWYSSSNQVTEYRDDRVIITEEYLYPGIHEYKYLVRPISKGDAKVPAAGAKLMYEPEVFGRTGNSSITVK
jgi:uncharacterized protein YfaS (alpha-2-macroglobulin family)